MKKFLSLVLALIMTMSLVTISAGAADFTDKSKINYGQAIDVVSAVKIVDGYADGSFNPQATLTRGAAAKIICNLILGPTTAGALHADAAPFKDVPADSTFAGYIAYCAKEGIVGGYADGTFKPGATLTGYAFMKMLLGALGYDAEIEGYNTPGNWSISVAKRALAIGLDNGLKEDFNGVKAVTREEACLYAFNTLQADLVEYDSKTNINVGGAEVIIAGTAAKAMTWNNSATKKTNIKDDNYVQFAEQYFNKLVKSSVTNDFGEPATKWTNKGLKIGTYVDAAAKTYAKNVELGKIYADLGMNQADTAATVYVNGEVCAPVKVSKNNEQKIASSAANKDLVDSGSIVNVYYDDDTNEVTICVKDVFAGEIANVDKKAATPFVNVSSYSTIKDKTGTAVTFKPKFETSESFAEDDVVLFTYSVSAGAVESVKLAESVEGTVNKYELDTSLDLAGTTYKYSKNIEFSFGAENAMQTKNDYTVYLDENGLAIYVTEKTFNSSDYAFVLAVESSTQTGFKTDRAKLLTADAKLMTVTVDDDYTNLANQIVTYRKDSDGNYVLRAAANADANCVIKTTTDAAGDLIKDNGLLKNGDVDDFYLANTWSVVQVDDGRVAPDSDYRYANSETVFVVMDTDNTTGKTTYSTYTGIKNAPTIDPNGNAVEAAWIMRGNVIGVMFIDATNADVTNGKRDVLFLAGEEAVSDLIVDSDNTYYYVYNAVQDGEITTVKVAANAVNLDDPTFVAGDDSNMVFTNVQTNNKGIITSVNNVDTYGTMLDIPATGIWKLSGEYTVGLGAAKDRLTVATDAKIYRIDTDGKITKLDSVKDIYSDANAEVIAVLNLTDGDLDYIFIQETSTNPKENASVVTPGVVTDLTYDGANTVTVEASKKGTYTVKVEVLSNGSYVTAATYTATVTTDGGTGTVNIGKLAAGNARITCGSKTVLA